MKKREKKIRENKGSDNTIVLLTSTSVKWFRNMKYACTKFFISVIITIKNRIISGPFCIKLKGLFVIITHLKNDYNAICRI